MKEFTGNKRIATNIYKVQTMCGYFSIGFINIMLKGSLLNCTILFSSSKYKKNNKIILNISQNYRNRFEKGNDEKNLWY